MDPSQAISTMNDGGFSTIQVIASDFQLPVDDRAKAKRGRAYMDMIDMNRRPQDHQLRRCVDEENIVNPLHDEVVNCADFSRPMPTIF
jgi:hypothetical protein